LDPENDATFIGEFVFIPMGAMFIQPATMVHGGGYRTGPRGNPRLHHVLFLVFTGNKGAKRLIPKDFTQTYIDKQQPEGDVGL
jgi:hypothetical protein